MEVPCRSLEVPCSGNPLIKRIELIKMKSFSPYSYGEKDFSRLLLPYGTNSLFDV
jgi:hypothetical protein